MRYKLKLRVLKLHKYIDKAMNMRDERVGECTEWHGKEDDRNVS